ncbi:hypothetical protein DMA11_03125 [Marinilabiliaceae bacterium JC017]|nr:hypothetical protein DMA11_03125 [Marinilabiliaceae bacterium JC017]
MSCYFNHCPTHSSV